VRQSLIGRCNLYSGISSTDEYGFSALPGGHRYSSSDIEIPGKYGYWWTATEDSGNYAYYRGMGFQDDRVKESDNRKGNGYSVRCVQ